MIPYGEHEIVFTSTPTSQEGIDELVAVGSPLLKNGSDLLTNLDAIRRMGKTQLPTITSCGMPIGLSDHTDGIIAGVCATSMGATVVEKHFSIDKNLLGPDHRFSSDPAELKWLIKTIREGRG